MLELNIDFDLAVEYSKQGIITPKARNKFIKAEYEQLPPDMRKRDKRKRLAERWCLDEMTIRNIIYNKGELK